MILSDRTITALLTVGILAIDPLDWDAQIQPASVDLTLGNSFVVVQPHKMTHIDPELTQDNLYEHTEVLDDDMFCLNPNTFALATTKERITLNHSLVGRVDGKSSLGRLGLLVHSTAGFVDPGFSGEITLELSNVSGLPIVLRPGMKVAQISFMKLDQQASRPYGSEGLGSKYQGQSGAVPSKYYLNGATGDAQ